MIRNIERINITRFNLMAICSYQIIDILLNIYVLCLYFIKPEIDHAKQLTEGLKTDHKSRKN